MKRSFHYLQLLLPLVLMAASLALYWPGLGGGFIFDDYPNLVYDPDWKVTTLDWREWQRALVLGISSDSGRPLALLSFSANYYFTGLDPVPMKLTGLSMHLLNGVLVYLLCKQLFKLAPARVAAERMGHYAATLVSLAWAMHPLQVSTVLYVVQRMEIGAHTGVLLALLAYLHARTRQQQDRRAWPLFLLCGLGMLFGLGFKETALLVPGYALILEICVFRFRTNAKDASRILVALYAASMLLALGFFLLVLLPQFLAPGAYAFRDFTLGQRLLTQMPVLTTYLGQILLPLPHSLLFYYDQFAVSTSLLSPPATLKSLVVLLGLVAAAFTSRHRWPLVTLGTGWFFVAHALTSNIVPLELAFEHRNYFALLGILIAAAQVLSWAGHRLNLDARRTLAVLPVVLLAFLCALQVHTWAEPFRLATTLGSRNPNSLRAGFNAGAAMLEKSGYDPDSPLFSLARQEFQHAARLPHSSPLPEQGIIIMLARTGGQIPRETWDSFRHKLKRRTAGVQEENAVYAVLSCRILQQCKFDDQQLFETVAAAVQSNPNSPKLHAMYANLAYNVLGDSGLAIQMARESILLAPDELQFKVNLAQFLEASGEHPDELMALRKLIQEADYYSRFNESNNSGQKTPNH